MTDCKIKTISAKTVELETADGKSVSVGYKKNAILLMKLQKMNVGETIKLDIKTSDASYGSNTYVDAGDDFAFALLKAKQYSIQSKLAENQMADLGI